MIQAVVSKAKGLGLRVWDSRCTRIHGIVEESFLNAASALQDVKVFMA